MLQIRKLQKEDIEDTVELWYEASLLAHDFIPADYWKENRKAMAGIYLPGSETFLAVEKEHIAGFISMMDDYLAAIFVDKYRQGQGIGKQLLNYVKEGRDCIQLKVFRDNVKSVQFYKCQGFTVLSEGVDEETEQAEYLMEWKRS